MNFYSIPSLLSAFSFFSLGTIVLLKSKERLSIRVAFMLQCLTSFWWQFSWFILFNTKSTIWASYLVKIGYSGIIFIPVTFFHFYIAYLNKNKKWVNIYYFIAFGFLIILWATNAFINNYYTYFWGYYPKASYLHPVYLVYLTIIATHCLYTLFSTGREIGWKGIKGNQIKYLFMALFVYTFASSDFLVNYGVEFYPLGFIFILISLGLVTYASSKYRLLDIRITLTRAGIFIVVYTLVLGIPFWIGIKFLGKGSWILPVSVMAVFATAGPFIYIFLQRRAESIILKEQRHYQEVLKTLSKTMVNIRDLNELLKTNTSTIVEAVRVSFAAIYFKSSEYNSFQLKTCHPDSAKSRFQEFVSYDDSLIKILNEQKKPLSSEEIGPQDKIHLDSGLVIPCFSKDGLLAIIILGAKPNNQMYTNDDMLTFETLSNQTALAIENCTYWKELEEKHRQARAYEMDLFSYSLAHEIDNPMAAIKTGIFYLRNFFTNKFNPTPDQRAEIERYFGYLLEMQTRVSSMVRAIDEFGNRTEGKLDPLKIEDVLTGFMNLYLPHFKHHGIYFSKDVPPNIPFIRGIKQELEEVLVILANNSIYALQEIKIRQKQTGQPQVSLKVELPNPDWIRIIFSDNGEGIRKEDLKLIFNAFVTTKPSSVGTGMGLYNAFRIIDKHKGRIWVESEGKDKGAAFIMELPVAKDITKEDFKKEEEKRKIF